MKKDLKRSFKNGFLVLEINPNYVKRFIGKVYPTWLGCYRVRNRIARSNKVSGYRYLVCPVFVMNKMLQIKVEVSTCNPSNPFRKVFDNRIELNDSISVPYESIISTLKFIYGKGSVVSFSIF